MLDHLRDDWRAVLFATVLAVLLLVNLLVPDWQAALLTGFTAAALFGVRGWLRFNPDTVSYGRGRLLQYQVAQAGLSAVAAQVLTMFPALGFGVPTVVLAIALGAAVPPAIQLVRLRGEPARAPGLPPTGAAGRFVFEGVVHALGGPQHVPGTDAEAALWVVRQRWRRWSSTGRVEVRGGDGRKAWIEPGGARPVRMPWNTPAIERGVAQALGGRADVPVTIWRFKDGDPIFAIGPVSWAPDPSEPWYRGPRRAALFAGELRLGWGWVGRLRREAQARLWLWLALAAVAGGFAVAATLGFGGAAS
jgi:hypothetical protein